MSSAGYRSVCALLLRNTSTCPHENILRHKTHPSLLRKQLHCPHSDDLLAPPRGVHPKNLKEGAFTVYQGHFLRFLLNEGAFTPDHALFR